VIPQIRPLGLGEALVYEPIVDQDGLRVSRSPWGPDDVVGRLNWMTDASRAAVLAAADGSRVYDLSVTYTMGMPAWVEGGDPKYDIWMTHTPRGTIRDSLTGQPGDVHRQYSYAGSAITMYSHAGTHLCSLTHFGHHGVFWNGITEENELGSRCWSVGGVITPIVARAVLLDVAAHQRIECLPESYRITASDLISTADHQSTTLQRGDIVLVRTGRMSAWPDAERFLSRPPGLSMDAAVHLCEEVGAMCLGVDAGGEAIPPEQADAYLPVHCYLFATAGTPLFENVWLEDIARERVYELAFVALPLKLAGSTGLPARPIAMQLRSAAESTLVEEVAL
jgi:kynurenine formamidase